MKLDLGCGKRKKDGFIGIDVSDKSDADIVYDLRNVPWCVGDKVELPMELGQLQPSVLRQLLDDKSVDEVFSSHFLEHLTGIERIAFMEELFRVLKVGAKATFIVPYGLHKRAFQDPTHAWPPLVEDSFLYFNKGWRKDNKLDHYVISADFDFTYGYALDPEISVKSSDYQQFAVKHYVNSVFDLQVVLTRRDDDK